MNTVYTVGARHAHQRRAAKYESELSGVQISANPRSSLVDNIEVEHASGLHWYLIEITRVCSDCSTEVHWGNTTFIAIPCKCYTHTHTTHTHTHTHTHSQTRAHAHTQTYLLCILYILIMFLLLFFFLDMCSSLFWRVATSEHYDAGWLSTAAGAVPIYAGRVISRPRVADSLNFSSSCLTDLYSTTFLFILILLVFFFFHFRSCFRSWSVSGRWRLLSFNGTCELEDGLEPKVAAVIR